jgi:hypothetical protein
MNSFVSGGRLVTALNFKEIWEEKRNYQSQNYLASTSAI